MTDVRSVDWTVKTGVSLSSAAKSHQYVMLIQGAPNAGKSTLAMTLDPAFPKTGLPTARVAGAAKITLKKVFWISFDHGATRGFKERGIQVYEFNVRDYMAKSKATIWQATLSALEAAQKAVAAGFEWIIPDTLSTFDKALDVYWARELKMKAGEKDATKSALQLSEQTQIQKYGMMFNSHKLFNDALVSLGVGVCYLTHSKANIDLGLDKSDPAAAEKKKAIKMAASSASGGVLWPDITGKGANVYINEAHPLLVLRAIRGPIQNGRPQLIRKLSADPIDGYMTKNTWELSLKGDLEPHLGKLIAMIEA